VHAFAPMKACPCMPRPNLQIEPSARLAVQAWLADVTLLTDKDSLTTPYSCYWRLCELYGLRVRVWCMYCCERMAGNISRERRLTRSDSSCGLLFFLGSEPSSTPTHRRASAFPVIEYERLSSTRPFTMGLSSRMKPWPAELGRRVGASRPWRYRHGITP